jgi:hypothetical protein
VLLCSLRLSTDRLWAIGLRPNRLGSRDETRHAVDHRARAGGERRRSEDRLPAASGGGGMPGLISPSALMLLAANLGVIAAAYAGDWSLPTVLASYLAQSVVIGLFQAKKMADLQAFSTAGLTMNGHAVDPTPATRRSVVLFFLAHYGFFHLVYAVFVARFGVIDWRAVAASCALFFANHLFSYFSSREALSKRVPNIGTMMFTPYIRILPMHIFILAGAFLGVGSSGMIAFMALKTLADEAMHLVEHRTGVEVG